MAQDKTTEKQLPNGWVESKLPDFCEIIMGQAPSSETYNTSGKGLPFYQGKSEFGSLYPTPQKYCTEPGKVAEKGSTLLCVRAPVGPTNLAPEKSCIGRGLAAIRGLGGVPEKFVLYIFRNAEPVISTKGTGTTFKAITKDFVVNLSFCLPPLAEQHRIVIKIEELFSELDNGVETLKKIQLQLKVYRQAVLKYAFEGKLTKSWRKANVDKQESPETLLAKIRVEREKHYQKQLAEWEKAKKTNEKISKPTKPKELPPLTKEELAELPELPKGWTWVRNDTLLEYVTSGSRGWAEYYSTTGAAFLRMGNLDHDTISIDLAKIQRVNLPKKAEGKRSLVRENDILVSVTADVGMIGIVPATIGEAYISQHVALARPLRNISSRYLAWFLASREDGQKQFRLLQRGATKVGLGLDDIRNVRIPLAYREEQDQVVGEIESRLSVCDKLEQSIEDSLKQAESLRQSILKKAFEGKLVAQDANDESASVLLERIHQQRSEQVQVRIAKKKYIKQQTIVKVKRKHSKAIYLRRGAVISYVVGHLSSSSHFGRTQLEKVMHLTQAHLGIDLEFEFVRQAAGPFDEEIIKVESLARKQEWFTTHKRQSFGVYYQPGPKMQEEKVWAVKILGEKKNEMDRLLKEVAKMTTEQAELFDTVYAVWNDLLIDGIDPTQEQIIEGVYNWHESKKRFPSEQIRTCIQWISTKSFVPSGQGKQTVVTKNGRML